MIWVNLQEEPQIWYLVNQFGIIVALLKPKGTKSMIVNSDYDCIVKIDKPCM